MPTIPRWLRKLLEFLGILKPEPEPQPQPQPWKPEPFENPSTPVNLPGTKSEMFEWTPQTMEAPHHGHPAGAKRVKTQSPSHLVNALGATMANCVAKMRRLKDGVCLVELPCYQIDTGEDGQSRRPKFEWWDFDKLLADAPVLMEVYVSGKMVERVRVSKLDEKLTGYIWQLPSE